MSEDPKQRERERTTGAKSAPQRERSTQKTALSKSGVTQPKELTPHQQSMLASAFQDAARARALQSALGTTGETPRASEEKAPRVESRFDGVTPAPEVVGRDLFKAVQAPVQSREGRRSAKLLQQVLNQFAVANNPRYAAQGPTGARGHIFVWDVSRAMSCEVPHFLGSKELNAAQTVDWVRHEGPTRGWTRGHDEDAVKAALGGHLVIALPREVRVKQLAIVLPLTPGADGKPRFTGAALQIGANLSLPEALGVYAAEYFIHA